MEEEVPFFGLKPPSPPWELLACVESSQTPQLMSKGRFYTQRYNCVCFMCQALISGDSRKFSLKTVDSNKLSHLQLTQVSFRWIAWNHPPLLPISPSCLSSWPQRLNVVPTSGPGSPVPGPFFCSHLPSPCAADADPRLLPGLHVGPSRPLGALLRNLLQPLSPWPDLRLLPPTPWASQDYFTLLWRRGCLELPNAALPLTEDGRTSSGYQQTPWELLVWCLKKSSRAILNMKVLVAQWCPTVYDPKNCSPPGSSVHGILQARILEWVAISSFRGSTGPRDWTQVSYTESRTWWSEPPDSQKEHLLLSPILEKKVQSFLWTPCKVSGLCSLQGFSGWGMKGGEFLGLMGLLPANSATSAHFRIHLCFEGDSMTMMSSNFPFSFKAFSVFSMFSVLKLSSRYSNPTCFSLPKIFYDILSEV